MTSNEKIIINELINNADIESLQENHKDLNVQYILSMIQDKISVLGKREDGKYSDSFPNSKELDKVMNELKRVSQAKTNEENQENRVEWEYLDGLNIDKVNKIAIFDDGRVAKYEIVDGQPSSIECMDCFYHDRNGVYCKIKPIKNQSACILIENSINNRVNSDRAVIFTEEIKPPKEMR